MIGFLIGFGTCWLFAAGLMFSYFQRLRPAPSVEELLWDGIFCLLWPLAWLRVARVIK